MSAFDSIMQGLSEAEVFVKGDPVNVVEHVIEVPEIDVRAVREGTGLSQSEFARNIGVPKATLQGWEQKRRAPKGPAKVLLAMIDRQPTIVRDTLTGRIEAAVDIEAQQQRA